MLTTPVMPNYADKINQKLSIPKATSDKRIIKRCDCGYSHEQKDGLYSREGYEPTISPEIFLTGRNYPDTISYLNSELKPNILPKDTRLSLSSEELAIAMKYIKEGKDPRDAKEFDDLFARNNEKRYLWLLTDTGLRIPKGYSGYEKDEKGNMKYRRIVLECNEEKGEVLIPVGDGRIITEFDEVFGLPSKTQEIAYPHKGYYVHFWFDPEKKEDVAVGFGSCRLDDEHDCLNINANYRRSNAYDNDGFRPVRGSVQAIKKTQ